MGTSEQHLTDAPFFQRRGVATASDVLVLNDPALQFPEKQRTRGVHPHRRPESYIPPLKNARETLNQAWKSRNGTVCTK